MPWPEEPVRMAPIALVAAEPSLRDALVRVADAGVVELDRDGDSPPEPAVPPRLSPGPPDIAELRRTEALDLLAGEEQLRAYAAGAVRRDGVAALTGWAPGAELPALNTRLAGVDAAAVRLPAPPGAEVPTLLRSAGGRGALTPLVQTYGTVPYADLDPTPLAWAAYVLMFGMMFGDAGHGALLLLAGLLLFLGRPRLLPRRLDRYRRAWPFAAGAGAMSVLFGLLYGEAFGPTGLVPVLWLAPLEEPVTLLVAGVGLGAVLLAGAYGIGTANRFREGGLRLALYAPSGLAGAAVFLGLGLAAGGWYLASGVITSAGLALAVGGLALAFTGFRTETGGAAGAVQAAVELFDLVVRLGSNVVSFARLAAFGLTHAALGSVVWTYSSALWERGGPYTVAAVLLFAAGNVLAFTLEALVAAVQALRLEYYELFSRVFVAQGRPFRPWHAPTAEYAGTEREEASCPRC